MSRKASPAGCSTKTIEFSLEEKQALLESVSEYDQFVDDPFAEIARAIGPENFAKIAEILGGEKVHIPHEAFFYRRLSREINKPNIIEFVLQQTQTGKSNRQACELAADKFKVSFSWVRDLVSGAH